MAKRGFNCWCSAFLLLVTMMGNCGHQQVAAPAPSTDTLPLPVASCEELHRDALVIDGHADTIQLVLAGRDLAMRGKDGHLDIPRMREGGLDAQFFAIFVDSIYQGEAAAQRTRQIIDRIEHICKQHSEQLTLVRSAGETEEAVENGDIAILMGIEGGHAINNSLTVLEEFYQRGVCYLGLTWSNTNDWADAAGDVVRHHGLSDFGERVVREMNRLGMLIDISHASDETFYDVLATSKQPVIASHSACRALTNHPRNLTDEMLRALARNGGVCCINFYSEFVDESYRRRQPRYHKPSAGALSAKQFGGNLDAWAVARFQRFLADNGNPPPDLTALIDHIDHAVKVAGIDHVGLGSDFDGISSLPRGLEDVSKLPAITCALAARGYSQNDIKKILGGNLLRVLRTVKGN
ncbi:MAG: dipeptidase [Acidobacteriota bacterium]